MLSIDELVKLPLFSALGPKELDYLARTVPDIHVTRGDYVVHEGEGRALIIVVEGKLEVTKVMNGEERVIANRLPGTLFGEVPIVLNSPFLASLRAVEPSRVIRIEPKVFFTLAAAAPEVMATVGRAAVERIGGLQGLAQQHPPRPEVLLIGPRFLPAIQTLRTFLHRNQIDFEWLAPEDPSALAALGKEGEGSAAPTAAAAERSKMSSSSEPTKYPLVRLPDGTVLVEPSVQTIAKAVGLSIAPSQTAYDVVIIGGGPAGMAAAVYGASEGLRTMLVEREAPGGQAGTSSRIENYLGFPFGVSGDELSTRALHQARRLGAEIVVTRFVERIDLVSARASASTNTSTSTSPQNHTLMLDGGDVLHARTIVLAMGVSWRRLTILDRLTGRGVYYGATRSEASSTQGRDVFLIGAGNSAGQAALFFASYARTVTLIVRGDALAKSMSHYLIQQLQAKPNVNVALRSEVARVHGGDQLEAIDIVNHRTGETTLATAACLFVFIGADASTDWLPAAIARDPRGYVCTGLDAAKSGQWNASRRDPFLLETSVPGVFAIGDVRAGSVKRVASAVGDGSLAITFVRQHLEETPP